MIQEPSSPFIILPNATLPLSLKTLLSARKEGYCRIANHRWQQLNMPKVSKSLVSWKVKNLDIEDNQHPSILLQISSIKFSHLTILNLSANNIESIEQLTRINTRNIQELNLTHNNISNIESLRRIHSFRLRVLKISNNSWRELDCLSFMPLVNLEVLVLENDVRKSDKFLNIWNILKLESVYLKSLYIRNWDQLFKKKSDNGQSVIRNRFSELNPGRNI